MSFCKRTSCRRTSCRRTSVKVFITGAAGIVGTPVTKQLRALGHEVLATDIVAAMNRDIQACDIMNLEALMEHMGGCDAVVHLAAFPTPALAASSETFQLNVTGTFNVYAAAEALGITRVVQASSVNAWGCFWGNQEHEPRYLPIDEAHPKFTTDAYSFSKQLVEDIATYYWRRSGIQSVSLRFPGVFQTEYFASNAYHEAAQHAHRSLDYFMKQDASTRTHRFRYLQQTARAFRQQFGMEFPRFDEQTAITYDDDPLWKAYLFDRMVYWTFVTTDEVAQSFAKSLHAEVTEPLVLFINNHCNIWGYDSQRLAQHFFPDTTLKRPLQGCEALIRMARAQASIGFTPLDIIRG